MAKDTIKRNPSTSLRVHPESSLRGASKQRATGQKDKSRLEFPQIFRKITAVTFDVNAKTLWRWFVLIIIVSVLLLQLVQLGQTLFRSYYEAGLKKAQKQAIEAEIVKWSQIVASRPNYRDAYFELAVLTYRLNRTDETKRYLAKVFELDPNYQPARELEKLIQH